MIVIFNLLLILSGLSHQLIAASDISLRNSSSTSSRRLASARETKKATRVARILKIIEEVPVPDFFKPTADSPTSNLNGPVICAVAMGSQYME